MKCPDFSGSHNYYSGTETWFLIRECGCTVLTRQGLTSLGKLSYKSKGSCFGRLSGAVCNASAVCNANAVRGVL